MPRVAIGQAEVGIYTYGRLTKTSKPSVCYVIDVSNLRDPQANRGFRNTWKDGRPGAIQKYVAEDARVDAIVDQIKLLAHMHKRSGAKDQKWLSFGLRDHHGRWTSPAVGEFAADALSNLGYRVSVCHVDLREGEGSKI